MSIKGIKMILPVPLPAAALDNFAAQIPEGLRRSNLTADFVGCRAGATAMDSAYESTLADAFVLDAGASAEAEGYDADVIVLGSTTMYQAHAHLVATLPCPVVSPGLAAYKACETLLHLGLAHSKLAYPAPGVLCDSVFNCVPRVF